MVVIFKLSPNDQQVPGKLPNISRKLPGMLSEYNTQLNLNKHGYKTVNIFVCCCHTVAEGADGAEGGGRTFGYRDVLDSDTGWLSHIIIYYFYLNFFKDPNSPSSSDSDTESSDESASEAFLKFPEEPNMHVDIGSTRDDDDDDEDRPGTYFNLPSSLSELRKELLQGYTTPAECPDTVSAPRELTPSETASLKHYIAWKKSNGTVLAYKLHAQVLQCTAGLEILSLYSVQQLAATLTDLWPSKTDMCSRSCIAYTGEFQEMDSCPYVHSGKICGELRYQKKSTPNARDKPRAQMMSLSFIPMVKAMFANAETAQLLRHRDKCLQKALHLLGTASQSMKYSDFGDSKVHIHHYQSMKLFQDPRDIAFAISTDGAQLTMKKHSNTWILILIFLNFPPQFRCQ